MTLIERLRLIGNAPHHYPPMATAQVIQDAAARLEAIEKSATATAARHNEEKARRYDALKTEYSQCTVSFWREGKELSVIAVSALDDALDEILVRKEEPPKPAPKSD